MTADIVILGAWKCGSTSLVEYLKQRFPDKEISKQELFHVKDERIELHNNKPDAFYYVILRKYKPDWYQSMWRFFYPDLTFREFMDLKDVRGTGMNANEMADWNKHIERWKGKVKNLIVLWLEEESKKPGFPHLNKTI